MYRLKLSEITYQPNYHPLLQIFSVQIVSIKTVLQVCIPQTFLVSVQSVSLPNSVLQEVSIILLSSAFVVTYHMIRTLFTIGYNKRQYMGEIGQALSSKHQPCMYLGHVHKYICPHTSILCPKQTLATQMYGRVRSPLKQIKHSFHI